MQTGAQRMEATLAHLVASGVDVSSVADAVCAFWCSTAAIMAPIIGQQGIAALYRRSLHLTRVKHPSLSSAYNNIGELGDFTTLREVLMRQTSKSAADTSTALIFTFYDLLSSLIGASLTERLLRSALDNPSTDHAAQRPSP